MSTLKLSAFTIFAALIGSPGCTITEEEGEDGIDDSFLDGGKADAFGVVEGSPDALALLFMLDSASLDELDNAAGLASHAAKAIIRHRQGGDRKDGTPDDDWIGTLTELDAIPYVGPMTFRLLLDHARATVPVPSSDPFDPTFCALDYTVSVGGIRAVVPEGSESVEITTSLAGVKARTRTCTTADSCTAWVAGSSHSIFVGADGVPAVLDIPAEGFAAKFGVAVDPDGRPIVMLWSNTERTNTASSLMQYCYPTAVETDDNAPFTVDECRESIDGQTVAFAGTPGVGSAMIGTVCSQFIQRSTEGTIQREKVFFARY